MYYIYQRVSTDTQSLARQENAIDSYCRTNKIKVPAENVFSDVITGKTINRDNYTTMKRLLKKHDVVIMLDLDRLGRNWDLIKAEWKWFTEREIYIIIINCPLINLLPNANGEVSIDRRLIQEMMFTLMCYLSQKEVEKISIRTKEALRAKKEQGVVLGRPKVHSDELIEKMWTAHLKGSTYDEIAEDFKIPYGTVKTFMQKKKKGLI